EAQTLDKLALALAAGMGVQYSVSGVQYSDTNREVTGAGDAPTANGPPAANSSTSPPIGQPTNPVIQESNNRVGEGRESGVEAQTTNPPVQQSSNPIVQSLSAPLAGPAGLLRP